MTRGALYARVSTARQEQERTIESQLEALHGRSRELAWDVPKELVLIDDGWSGARLDRPGLDALRDAAAEGRFDALLVYDPDRLARNFVHQQLLLEELERRRVQVHFLERPLSERPEDRLLVQMQGVFAEYERAKIADRTRRGRLHKARTLGWSNWVVAPYGYRIVVGSDKMRRLEVNEDEAHWVRQAYRWVLEESASARRVAKRLNDLGVRPRRGRIWMQNTACRVLTKSLYAGTAHYNKHQSVEPKRRRRLGSYPKKKKSSQAIRPPDQWIPVPVPAIVTPAEQMRVKERLKANRVTSPRNTRYEYLLRTLVVCGECGWKMNAVREGGRMGFPSHEKTYSYYTCQNKPPVDTGRLERCKARRVRCGELDRVVWEALCEWLQQPEVLRTELEALESVPAGSQDVLVQEAERLQMSVKVWEQQVQRLVDAYQGGAVRLDELWERRREIEKRIEAVRRRLGDIDSVRRQKVKTDDLLKSVDAFAATLRDGLDRLTFEERQRVVRLLVERVVVRNGDVTIEHIVPLTGRYSGLRSQNHTDGLL